MEITAKTFFGLEKILAKEIEELGGKDIKIGNRNVRFEGDIELLYKANIYLRTAVRLLIPIHTEEINSQDNYYEVIRKISWEKYMNLHQTFLIDAVLNSDIFKNTHFGALRAKDAIADFFYEKYKKRPFVDKDNPDMVINVHLYNKQLTLSLDSSGFPLFKRGYRVKTVEAPINEVLAAGIILMSGWTPAHPFIDPMCGSGTFSIEAAMIARKMPPGLVRRTFAFQNWADYDKEMFMELLNNVPISDDRFKIFCSDISEENLETAKINSDKALVKSKIKYRNSDFFQYEYKLKEQPYIFLNPPYGDRLKESDILDFYSEIGKTLKHNFADAKVFLISSNKKALKHIGLKPDTKDIMYNGALECSLNSYTIFDGKLKQYKANNK